MSWISALSFAHPAALAGLIALPVIWWLLRAVPPRPERVRFAPFRLLLRLRPEQETAARTPWWLVALRMLIAAAFILAVAGPRMDPAGGARQAGRGTLLLVMDDGWAAAANWQAMQAALLRLLEEAREAGRPVILATTTPAVAAPDLAARAPRQVMRRARALAPRALTPARMALLRQLKAQGVRAQGAVWLSNGLDHGAARAFVGGLAELAADVRVLAPSAARLPLVLGAPVARGGKLQLSVLRPRGQDGERRVRITLKARNGRPLAQAEATFHGSAGRAHASIALPLAVRNEVAMAAISGQRHAAAVWLFDDAMRGRSVLVLSGETRGRDQPLLSPAYYVLRALQPLAEVRQVQSLSEVEARLGPGLSMLVLADVGRLDRARQEKIARWVRSGGVLLRFAGPRLAGGHDELVPVRLRAGGRRLGAALSWEKPQGLAPFAESSPLAGLAVDGEVKVSRQVLAEPGPELALRTWASLQDGTPLITARKEGAGLVVLVHVTAGPQWSSLPLSGLFVDILGRILNLAPPARARAREAAIGNRNRRQAMRLAGPWTPLRALDGFGAPGPVPAEAQPLKAQDMVAARPSPRHPAGLYGRGGALRALNVGQGGLHLAPLPKGIVNDGYALAPMRDFSQGLFLAAFLLFLLDGLAVAWLAGVLRWRGARAGGAVALLALGMLQVLPPAARAEPDAATAFAMKATEKTRLAYVLTGRAEVDEISRAGLSGLSAFLAQRTSVEPGEPMGVNPERDDISFFPLLYWPVLADAKAPSPAAVARLDVFLKNGGTILFDTRDAPEAGLGGMTPQRRALKRILSGLDIPPLEPVPRRHVLRRSFYLLKGFPGRHSGARLWVEATSAGAERERLSPGNADGVSAILITGNDMAGAWALTRGGRPLLPVVPGGARQREMAIRAGINIVMYALTGNYKADQVHIPAILRRLGQ